MTFGSPRDASLLILKITLQQTTQSQQYRQQKFCMVVIRKYSERSPLTLRPMCSGFGRSSSKYSLLVRAYSSRYRTVPQPLKSLAPICDYVSLKCCSVIAWGPCLLVIGYLVIPVNPLSSAPLINIFCSKIKYLIKVYKVWEAWYKISHRLSLWLVPLVDTWLVDSDDNSIYTSVTCSFKWKQIASAVLCSLEEIKMHLM